MVKTLEQEKTEEDIQNLEMQKEWLKELQQPGSESDGEGGELSQEEEEKEEQKNYESGEKIQQVQQKRNQSKTV